MPAGASIFFLDTNVLLYALDGAHPAKQRPSAAWLQHLWQGGNGRLSWQVLHEFYWNATRKLGLGTALTRGWVNEFVLWRPIEASPGLLALAWEWQDRAQLAYWDALILAAALRSDAVYLLSEDFQAGRRYGACTVVNPFSTPPSALI
jgi:predicted nucleic acid-binding protein